METNVLDQRIQFVRDFESGQWSMTELCERYRVTRPTGYKWIARHREGGEAGLIDRSRAPGHALDEALVAIPARPPAVWLQVLGDGGRGCATRP